MTQHCTIERPWVQANYWRKEVAGVWKLHSLKRVHLNIPCISHTYQLIVSISLFLSRTSNNISACRWLIVFLSFIRPHSLGINIFLFDKLGYFCRHWQQPPPMAACKDVLGLISERWCCQYNCTPGYDQWSTLVWHPWWCAGQWVEQWSWAGHQHPVTDTQSALDTGTSNIINLVISSDIIL